MKKLTLLLLFIPMLMIGQDYHSVVLFDMDGVTGDTTRSYSVKTQRSEGSIAEIDFTSVNCDLLQLNFGYGLTDFAPVYIDTIPTVSFPITLDKTVYTSTYLGIDNSTISIDVTRYSANYLWFNIIDNASCTSGEIILRIKK